MVAIKIIAGTSHLKSEVKKLMRFGSYMALENGYLKSLLFIEKILINST